MSIVHSVDASACPSCVHMLLVFVCSGTRSGEPSHTVCRLCSLSVCAPCTCCCTHVASQHGSSLVKVNQLCGDICMVVLY